LLHTHAPLRTVNIKHKPNPWLSNDIKILMKRRDRIQRNFRQTRLPHLFAEYKSDPNQVPQKILPLSSSTIVTVFLNEWDAKSTWQEIRRLGLGKPRCDPPQIDFPLVELSQYFITAIY
jgi:hypothetical protein